MRPILTITALATLSCGAPAALAQDGASLDAKAAIEGFLTDAALLGADTATVGTVTQNGDVVEVSNVSVAWELSVEAPDGGASAALEIVIPTLTVEGLEATAEGHRADRIAMPTLDFAFDAKGADDQQARYDLTATDYVIEDVSWGAFPVIAPDETKPISRFAPFVDWMTAVSYQNYATAGVTGLSVIDGGRQEVSYGPMAFGPVVNGRLEAFEYGPVTQTQTMTLPPDENGREETVELAIEYGVVRGKGLDAKPLTAFLTGTGASDGPQPLLEEMSLDGIRVDGDAELSVDLGSFTLENFTIDASGAPLLARLDPLAIAAIEDTEPNVLELINLMLDVYGAFGVGRYIVDDVAFETADASAKLGQFALEGVSRNGIDRLALSTFDLKSPEVDIEVGNVSQRGYRFPTREAVMQLLFATLAGMEPDPATIMAVVPTLDEFAVTDLVVAPAGLPSPVAVEALSVNMGNFIGPIPTEIDLALDGFQMPRVLVMDPQAQMALEAMNVDPLRVDGDISLRWDEDSRRVEIGKDITVEKVGAFKAEAVLSGIERAVFEDPMAAQAAMATAAINSLSATFTNGGLADFLINMMSAQTGVSPEDFASAMATQAQLQISMMTGSKALAATISDAVGTFLGDPQRFSVSLSPERPVTAAEILGAAMTAPDALPGLLNVTVTAND